ncbi:SPOR domain-containing protein [Mesoterricola sediminis]|uniref:SPOR domain-containing protein n=1 Tax=Mesoterricola sediminis TaxID=2927980 RepID=A0AA48KF15_9BACT|nr:SPOR domain-containing protein [Mesoterricola sediminis]BDU78605.1 hypothetical protein METESE_35630 [Mesoterricola sediminis]
MAIRDSQTVVLSRQAILLVTAVGVGLLTLCYVLGVQVGKQSAALRRPLSKGAGEELDELPASLADQLKALEQTGAGAGFTKPQKPVEPKPEAPAETKAPAAPEPARKDPEPAPAKEAEAEGLWVLQIVSTPDAAEAKAMLAKARAAGFQAQTVHEKNLYKVRVQPAAKRAVADATAKKLKNHGFKPFAVRAEP